MRIKLIALFVLLLPATIAWSQPDTIPVHLVRWTPIDYEQVVFRSHDTIIASNYGEVQLSTDDGVSFIIVDSNHTWSYQYYLTQTGALWRINGPLRRAEVSRNNGSSWDSINPPRL